MGFGESVKINIKEYIKVLAKVESASEQLSAFIKDEKIYASATCYVGPSKGDGEILIGYKKKDKFKGMFKFSENGELKDMLTDKTVKTFSKQTAKIFIAGLFGEEELSMPLKKSAEDYLSGIVAAKGCYDSKKSTPCLMDLLEKPAKKNASISDNNTSAAKEEPAATKRR